jgi:hypothetical protein
MLRKTIAALGMIALMAGSAAAAGIEKAPPPEPYKKVSTLVKLPDFLSGLGTLYVDPKTLPAGPFLAYDHSGTRHGPRRVQTRTAPGYTLSASGASSASP